MYTQFFGNYLLANGYVTRDQLFSAMRQEADQHMKLGTLAIHAVQGRFQGRADRHGCQGQ